MSDNNKISINTLVTEKIVNIRMYLIAAVCLATKSAELARSVTSDVESLNSIVSRFKQYHIFSYKALKKAINYDIIHITGG